MFGLTLIPVVGFVGAAYDYARAASARARLQAAVDMAALAASRLPSTTTQSAFDAEISRMVSAYAGSSAGASVTATSARETNKITVAATATVNTTLASVLTKYIPISAESTVQWGNTRLRVALALDVTGSMGQSGKLSAMKTAAKNLLAQLKTAATADGDVYVSIIPFAKDVNVGASNRNEPWVKWSGSSDTWDESNQTNGECSKNRYDTRSSCLEAGKIWTPDHSKWNGCVMDRDQNYDTTNTAPTTWSTNFPAEQYASCPVALMGLSYDWTGLTDKIESLSAGGSTNQSIGLAWAFQSLTAAPFTIPALDPKYQYKQVIILLSDGLNTQNRVYGNGATHSTQVDARQRILCDNVKASGIKLYTVQVNTDGAPTSALLQSCASDASGFFLLTSADQIITTFNQIGTELSQLRVSK